MVEKVLKRLLMHWNRRKKAQMTCFLATIFSIGEESLCPMCGAVNYRLLPLPLSDPESQCFWFRDGESYDIFLAYSIFTLESSAKLSVALFATGKEIPPKNEANRVESRTEKCKRKDKEP